ncbi:hypothetical protein CBS101457_005157 [Exobasidium rhododendri]|nr:hypothetical protein CBS101457_005157 [Exobasidium rhododendri]
MSCCAEHQVLSSAPAFILQSWTTSPYLTTLLLGPPLLLLILLYPALVYLSPGRTTLSTDAYFYVTAQDPKGLLPLPKLVEESKEGDEAVQLSVVIPAFNETSRLPKMLKETISHLEELRTKGKNVMGDETAAGKQANGHSHSSSVKAALQGPLSSYEILIIDDGSRDGTVKEALAFANMRKDLEIRLIKMGRNCGKGAAVRHGVLHSRGHLVIFCDADGATRFSDLSVLAKEMNRIITPAGHGIVCGSRAHLVGSEAVVKRSFVRNLLMHSFHIVLSLLMRPPNPFVIFRRLTGSSFGSRQSLPSQPPIKDTQCGFKLFSRQSAKAIFPLSHIDRWIFDVELLLLAEMASSRTLIEKGASADWSSVGEKERRDPLQHLPLPIGEVAVEWREVEGSKIDLLKDSIGMALDLLVIRLNYALGRWKTPSTISTAKGSSCC